jgi:hypothetical protein
VAQEWRRGLLLLAKLRAQGGVNDVEPLASL